ncbi:MAG TPA: TatD family hydrolase [Paludibacteraceae bacterium]|nr:TatD family hydrolase [Paludibacteraceae bacterium]HPT43578.1 TatD family hydrolase [Paludibacteraceae bacterium]
MIDTHSHIYSEEFDSDRDEVILRAQHAGVTKIILPNVDSDTLPRLLELEARYPDYCYAAIGLHPESVKEDYLKQLEIIKAELERRKYIAVGEIGIDLYWDKNYQTEQIRAFQTQVEWAIELNLPVIIHVRNSHRETIDTLKHYAGSGLKGIFHCFGGTPEEADEIFSLGDFKLGIGGVVTFKNSGLADSLMHIPLEKLVLETDSPYLTPAPFRGKRNESSYLRYVAVRLAEIYNVSQDEVDRITTESTCSVFSGLK